MSTPIVIVSVVEVFTVRPPNVEAWFAAATVRVPPKLIVCGVGALLCMIPLAYRDIKRNKAKKELEKAS